MTRTPNAIATVMRLALLSLMLAVQGMAYAHQVDHLSPVDGNECAACVAGHAFGAAIPVADAPPPVERIPAPVTRPPAPGIARLAVVPFGARAPPHHS